MMLMNEPWKMGKGGHLNRQYERHLKKDGLAFLQKGERLGKIILAVPNAAVPFC